MFIRPPPALLPPVKDRTYIQRENTDIEIFTRVELRGLILASFSTVVNCGLMLIYIYLNFKSNRDIRVKRKKNMTMNRRPCRENSQDKFNRYFHFPMKMLLFFYFIIIIIICIYVRKCTLFLYYV